MSTTFMLASLPTRDSFYSHLRARSIQWGSQRHGQGCGKPAQTCCTGSSFESMLVCRKCTQRRVKTLRYRVGSLWRRKASALPDHPGPLQGPTTICAPWCSALSEAAKNAAKINAAVENPAGVWKTRSALGYQGGRPHLRTADRGVPWLPSPVLQQPGFREAQMARGAE